MVLTALVGLVILVAVLAWQLILGLLFWLVFMIGLIVVVALLWRLLRQRFIDKLLRPGSSGDVVVYVLRTDKGIYVGHTQDLGVRINQHVTGRTMSTAGTNPTLVWASRPFSTREDAALYEAYLRYLNAKRDPRFTEETGLEPQPFEEAYAF